MLYVSSTPNQSAACATSIPVAIQNAFVNFFSIVITIQSQAGGNLSEALGNLSRVLRERKKMKAKVKAMSSEAKASAGIIGSLPFAVGGILTFIAPQYVAILFETSAGNWCVFAGFLIMTIGVLVMRKMINFEI